MVVTDAQGGQDLILTCVTPKNCICLVDMSYLVMNFIICVVLHPEIKAIMAYAV